MPLATSSSFVDYSSLSFWVCVCASIILKRFLIWSAHRASEIKLKTHETVNCIQMARQKRRIKSIFWSVLLFFSFIFLLATVKAQNVSIQFWRVQCSMRKEWPFAGEWCRWIRIASNRFDGRSSWNKYFIYSLIVLSSDQSIRSYVRAKIIASESNKSKTLTSYTWLTCLFMQIAVLRFTINWSNQI